MKFKWVITTWIVTGALMSPCIWAEAPVEDVNVDSQQASASTYPTQDNAVNDDTSDDNSGDNNGTMVRVTDNGDAGNTAAAAPPVVDTSNMPMNTRVARVEQQLNNMAGMNLPQQVTELQQQIAELCGQIEVQNHDLQLLNKQVQAYYQDLDNRLNSKTGGVNSAPAAVSADNASTQNQLQDTDAYKAAVALLTKHQWNPAQQKFSSYINQYPKGRYIADAHYWLGAIYLTQKKYPQAETEFTTVTSQYASSPKVDDAQLKLAIVHASVGKIDQAKRELRAIKLKHPNSITAQLATIRLQQLEQAG